MKLLVLSDSHSSLRFMRLCMDKIKPDGVIHLGDYYDDGEVLKEEYPNVLFRQVPGNCDRFRCPPYVQEILIDRIFGVDFYLTHGHHHSPDNLPPLPQGTVFLSGHTHVKLDKTEGGIRCLNPGSVSIPKEDSWHGYMTLEDGHFRWMDFDGACHREYQA